MRAGTKGNVCHIGSEHLLVTVVPVEGTKLDKTVMLQLTLETVYQTLLQYCIVWRGGGRGVTGSYHDVLISQDTVLERDSVLDLITIISIEAIPSASTHNHCRAMK